jgi:hypothetical protein
MIPIKPITEMTMTYLNHPSLVPMIILVLSKLMTGRVHPAQYGTTIHHQYGLLPMTVARLAHLGMTNL